MKDELQSLYEKGLHKEVIQKASQLSFHPSNDPFASLIIAASLLQIGQLRQCQAVCAELESVLAKDAQYLTIYGTCLRRLGEHQLSEKVFKHGLSIYPDHLTLNNNYANLLMETGKLSESRQILQRLVAQNPDYSDARVNLDRVKSLQKEEQASIDSDADSDTITSTKQEVDDLLKQASATPEHRQSVSLEQVELGIDPLRLAFSEHEVKEEQEQRRKRKMTRKTKPSQSESEQNWDEYPNLPVPPIEEHRRELARAACEALAEKQPEATLILTDMLQRYGSSERLEAYAIAAEAFILLKNFSSAEILYLCIESEATLDFNQCINLTILALERNDALRASICLKKAISINPSHPRIADLQEKVKTMSTNSRMIAIHPYTGFT
jgi:tetratricopeptide (TPR) repeat protein